ncbi:methyltransferase domain-containing protein [Sneathiella glossodoripedis]|uniref:methyltransferase domain-containing protein n=1 Tax=Sneathiella glossodoripedis TaxID=418853 RepID=UPI001901D15E|nr:methyltransferase domain-containing protein [Sneathiella glossodoripedis]
MKTLNWAHSRFLFDEVSNRLAERLLDIDRTFDKALDLGCHTGAFGHQISTMGRALGVIAADLSDDLMDKSQGYPLAFADEEYLPFAPTSFDLIGSVLSLHWVNDLPGSLVQIFRCLKADGLFLGAMFGAETLTELKDCLMTAELELTGGVSPRVSPFVDVRDAGSLLQRAGFALPVTDSEILTLKYQNMFALMHELRAMGETNALVERPKTFSSRKLFMRAAEIYHEKYQDQDGLVPATFQIVYLAGWAPHESQQKPLTRGSGVTSLKEVLGSKSD